MLLLHTGHHPALLHVPMIADLFRIEQKPMVLATHSLWSVALPPPSHLAGLPSRLHNQTCWNGCRHL
jgi:hypothetical protein